MFTQDGRDEVRVSCGSHVLVDDDASSPRTMSLLLFREPGQETSDQLTHVHA